MKKVIFAATAVAILAIGAIFVVAQHAGHKKGDGFGGGPGHHMMGLGLRGLDLTDDQKTKVKSIMEASRTTVEPLMKQMHENRAKLRDSGKNGAFDQAAVESLAAEQGNIMAKLIVEREKTRSQIFALLTDDQKAKAAQMQEKMKDHFKGGKGFGTKPEGSEF